MTGFAPGVWLLTLAYVAVAALLLNLNLATPRRGAIKVIAIALGLQEVTIKLHIRKLLRKLRVANRTQAAAIAIQSGWESEL